jgi:hypothetical protein
MMMQNKNLNMNSNQNRHEEYVNGVTAEGSRFEGQQN